MTLLLISIIVVVHIFEISKLENRITKLERDLEYERKHRLGFDLERGFK